MESAPIQRGTARPRRRPRHALVLFLVRLVAITGFALAGWLVLAALTESASAAEPPAHPDGTVRTTAPAFADLASGKAGVRPVLGGMANGAPQEGGRPLPSFEVPERLQEIGDDPVRFLQVRRHEVFERKDRAVRQVGRLADAAGVPRVRMAGVRPETPIVGGLVHDIADVRPALLDGEPPAESHERPADGGTRMSDEERRDAAASRGAGAEPPLMPGASAGDEAPDGCTKCQGDRHRPGPTLPSGQDNPRGGGSGGPTFAPVADLLSGRYPAAPPAAGPSTFRRTALTDVAAPGGPSVVPD